MICAAAQVHTQRIQAHLCRVHRHATIFSARVHLAACWRSPAESSAGRSRQWLVTLFDLTVIKQSQSTDACAQSNLHMQNICLSLSEGLTSYKSYTPKTFCCVMLGLEDVRGCHAGVRRLLHELIDSIHSWDEESDEHAMVDMLASFPQERFEVGYTTLLLRPLSLSLMEFSAPVTASRGLCFAGGD